MDKTKARTSPHAMLREIYEQPRALRRTLDRYLRDGSLSLEAFQSALPVIPDKRRLLIAASGSSRHAGLAGEILIEDLSGLPVEVEYASEYIYRSTRMTSATCTIVISQSGETADTLEALREAQIQRCSTVAITNCAGSSMSRLADCSLPTEAGVERAVPATKSFTSQLLVLYLFALLIARLRGNMTNAAVSAQLLRLTEVPETIEEALSAWEATIVALIPQLDAVAKYLFLGRGIHFPIAREGALKLKESAYISAEGHPAGEFRHGLSALSDESSCFIVLATIDASSADSRLRYHKTIQLPRHMRAQGARVIALATVGDTVVPELCSHCIFAPLTSEHVAPILEVIPLQLFAYHSAVRRGVEVDAPRNLVKAVLVE